jgi:ABC-type Na+ efflux pump permease subunit
MRINPVLDKEFRVLSRRRHTYVTRSAFLLFLAGLLWVHWELMIRQAQRAEMAGANWMNMVSRFVTVQVMGFLFLGMQLLAVILLSSSLSEERQHRRLDVLRCTPLSHGQIVSGKLVSRVLQLFLLLAMSLPVFGIIRAWGGISMAYLAHAMAVTGLTCLFAAVLSAWLSLYLVRPVHVVLCALVVLVGLFSLQILGVFSVSVQAVLLVTNPYAVMDALGTHLTHPGPNAPFPPDLLQFYGVMAGLIVLFLALAAGGLTLIRPGQDPVGPAQRVFRHTLGVNRRRGVRLVAWLDLRFYQGLWLSHLMTALGLGLPLMVLFAVGARIQWQRGILRVRELCIPALYFIVLVRTVTTATTSIGREKEGRSWAGLLLTPLSNRQILYGKAWVILATHAMGWLILLATLILFSRAMSRVGWFMNPHLNSYRLLLAICQMIGYGSFAVGVSLFWAVRLRRSLTALVMSLLSLSAAYGVYRFGLQSIFSWWILPWLSRHGPSTPMTTYVFGFAFMVAAVQCILGMGFFLWTQWRLRAPSIV